MSASELTDVKTLHECWPGGTYRAFVGYGPPDDRRYAVVEGDQVVFSGTKREARDYYNNGHGRWSA